MSLVNFEILELFQLVGMGDAYCLWEEERPFDLIKMANLSAFWRYYLLVLEDSAKCSLDQLQIGSSFFSFGNTVGAYVVHAKFTEVFVGE